jgi:hypothetical protein
MARKNSRFPRSAVAVGAAVVRRATSPRLELVLKPLLRGLFSGASASMRACT